MKQILTIGERSIFYNRELLALIMTLGPQNITFYFLLFTLSVADTKFNSHLRK